MVGRELAKGEDSFLDAQLASGGVLLWVRTPDANGERRAAEVLRRYSTQLYVHELPTEWRSVHAEDCR